MRIQPTFTSAVGRSSGTITYKARPALFCCERAGRACRLCPGISDVDLFSDGKGIVYLNTEVPHGAFDFGVTKQELDGS